APFPSRSGAGLAHGGHAARRVSRRAFRGRRKRPRRAAHGSSSSWTLPRWRTPVGPGRAASLRSMDRSRVRRRKTAAWTPRSALVPGKLGQGADGSALGQVRSTERVAGRVSPRRRNTFLDFWVLHSARRHPNFAFCRRLYSHAALSFSRTTSRTPHRTFRHARGGSRRAHPEGPGRYHRAVRWG